MTVTDLHDYLMAFKEEADRYTDMFPLGILYGLICNILEKAIELKSRE